MKPIVFVKPAPTNRPGQPDLSMRVVICGGGVALVPHAIAEVAPDVVTPVPLDRFARRYHPDNGR